MHHSILVGLEQRLSLYKIKLLLTFLVIFNISLSANNTYYEHKVSQFKILSKQSDKKIVMLGDSITERGLWSELTSRHDIVNRGISGDTVSGVLNRMNSLNNSLKQAFVMIGVNDILRGQSIEYIFKNYKIVISILKEKGITPIIQSVLYLGQNTPLMYNKKVNQLNALLFNYAFKNEIKYINLNKHLSPNGYLSSHYSSDNLHLNGSGYVVWIKTIEGYYEK